MKGRLEKGGRGELVGRVQRLFRIRCAKDGSTHEATEARALPQPGSQMRMPRFDSARKMRAYSFCPSTTSAPLSCSRARRQVGQRLSQRAAEQQTLVWRLQPGAKQVAPVTRLATAGPTTDSMHQLPQQNMLLLRPPPSGLSAPCSAARASPARIAAPALRAHRRAR